MRRLDRCTSQSRAGLPLHVHRVPTAHERFSLATLPGARPRLPHCRSCEECAIRDRLFPGSRRSRSRARGRTSCTPAATRLASPTMVRQLEHCLVRLTPPRRPSTSPRPAGRTSTARSRKRRRLTARSATASNSRVLRRLQPGDGRWEQLVPSSSVAHRDRVSSCRVRRLQPGPPRDQRCCSCPDGEPRGRPAPRGHNACRAHGDAAAIAWGEPRL